MSTRPVQHTGVAIEEVTGLRERSFLQGVIASQPFWVTVALLVICLAMSWLQPQAFASTDNLYNITRNFAFIAIMALGMTAVILTGGIDLSVGSIMGLCAILLGYGWKNLGLPLPASIALSLGVGALAGFVNGWLIARVGVPPLIQTLATLALYRGLAEGISQARSVRGYPDWFFTLGQGDVLGVPTQLWLWAVAIVLCAIVLSRTASAARSTSWATTRPRRASRGCRSTA